MTAIDFGIIVVTYLFIWVSTEWVAFSRAKKMIWRELERAIATKVETDVGALYEKLTARARAEVSGDGLKDSAKGDGPGSG